jgi:hypothetical protein
MPEKIKTIYAEDVPYFKTGKSAPDVWIDRAKREIASIDGKVLGEAFGSESSGRAAFLLSFQIGDEKYQVTWPVLPCKSGNERATRVQAATALYHDVKARVVSAKFLGIRGAFFNYLMLPNGRTAGETAAQDFLELVPRLMLPTGE